MSEKTSWYMEGDYLQACNCDYGCPCEFSAPPTYGFCEGVGAWRIERGRYGDIVLDGLGLAFSAHWPGQIHEGNGTAALYFDEKADEAQRKALLNIATAKDGGMPFEILVTTLTTVLEPQFVPFRFDLNGFHSGVRVGDAVDIAFEPIKNPATGAEERVAMNHETGFIFQNADCVSSRKCVSTAAELAFSHPNKAGFVARVKYQN